MATTELDKISKYDSAATELFNPRRLLNAKDMELNALKNQVGNHDGDVVSLKKLIGERDATVSREQEQNRSLIAQLAEKKAATATQRLSPTPVLVKLLSVTARQEGSCPATTPVFVVERFLLKSEGDPAGFILVEGTSAASIAPRKANDSSGIFRTDPSLPGWIVSYCASPGWHAKIQRRFINAVTGASSALIPVTIDA